MITFYSGLGCSIKKVLKRKVPLMFTFWDSYRLKDKTAKPEPALVAVFKAKKDRS